MHDGVHTHGRMRIEAFFDPATWTLSYLVLDTATRRCALVDTVLDYDPKSGRTRHHSAQRLVDRVRAVDAQVDWILETHVHADHLSAANWLKEQLGGQVAIGAQVCQVQAVFGDLFGAGPDFARDGRQFDRLLADGDEFAIGDLRVRVLHTPGHTPACLSYHVHDPATPEAAAAVFVGDTLFMPDYGTARCDFPGGDARALYRSIQRLLGLPPDTMLYMCHDYLPAGRALRWSSTVAEQRQSNIHVAEGHTEEAFVALRTARDRALEMPVLILPSVQVNMRAGALPPPEPNGTRYLKIPLDRL